MSANRSSAWGHVMLLAMALLLPVSIWLKKGRSLVYCPTSDADMIMAVIAIAAGLAAIYVPILAYRRRRCRASGDVHDSVLDMKRRAARQTVRKTEPARATGILDLENGLVWLETNATVPEADAICKRLKIMKIDFGVRQTHVDNAFHGRYGSGCGLGTKMGVFVRKDDYKRARSVVDKMM